MALGRSAYRLLLKCMNRFEQARIPLTGCVRTRLHMPTLHLGDGIAVAAQAQREAKADTGSLDDAMHVIRWLPVQHQVLAGSDDRARECLHQWWQLLDHHRRRVTDPITAGEAVERAAFLVHGMTQPDPSTALVHEDEEEMEERRAEARVRVEAGKKQLAELGQELQALVREGSIPAAAGGGGGRGQSGALQAIAEVLFRRRRFREVPFEWVYDGLAPMMLPDVLHTSKGMSLSLCALAVAVAARANVPLQMVNAAPTSGGLPEFLDPVAKGAFLMSAAEAAARFPDAGPQVLEEPWSSRCVLAVWRDLARTVLMAYQRRGESDNVAVWLYQLLALDTNAPEWDFMLPSSAPAHGP